MSTYWLINAQSVNNFLLFDPVNLKIEQHHQLKGWKDVPDSLKGLKKDSRLISYLLFKKNIEFKFIEDLIVSKGLPRTFSFLPLILSGYQSSYKSKKGGCGIWDLNYVTALHHGIEMNRAIDERRNDSISTLAAISELERLMKLYNDEKSCMLAYICSPSYVYYASKKPNIVDKYVVEAENQYKNIIEFINFLECLSLSNKNKIIESKDLELVQFKLNYNLTFDAISFNKKINLIEFRKNNPELISDVIPSGYLVKSCFQESEFLILNQEKIFQFQDSMIKDLFHIKDTVIMKVHIVKKGDVLGKISQSYNVSIENIKLWNNLTNNTIYVDQKLNIYLDTNFTKNQIGYYELKENETYWEIVHNNPNFNLLDILKINKYSSIKTEKKLKIIKK
tara:strand:- start:20702 stop:21880 length:1179 start_codon:yes stop_codon:yes gene_type:complete